MAGDTGEGFTSRSFAESYTHEGEVLEMPASGSWVVRRTIPGNPRLHDAIGLYPLMCCRHWDRLGDDLEHLRDIGIVSVTAVLDPFAPNLSSELLNDLFPDLLVKYKKHLVVNLAMYDMATLGKHHRRNLRVAIRDCAVRVGDPMTDDADEWLTLYEGLRQRRVLDGRANLPDEALLTQARARGATLFRADVDGRVAGMQLWLCSGHTAYYHLGAYNEIGYLHRAAYALMHAALTHFRSLVPTAHLGAGAGVHHAGDDDGLLRFKSGWSNSSVDAYLAGAILDPSTYVQLGDEPGSALDYFPRYRTPIGGSRRPAVARRTC